MSGRGSDRSPAATAQGTSMVHLSHVRPIRDLAGQANCDADGCPIRPGDVVRVYVAAPRASAREARALVLALRALQFPALRVVSRWINRCIADPVDPAGDDERSAILANNVIDLGWADIVIALMHRGAPRATVGDIVWALANDTPVVWDSRDRRRWCRGHRVRRNLALPRAKERQVDPPRSRR